MPTLDLEKEYLCPACFPGSQVHHLHDRVAQRANSLLHIRRAYKTAQGEVLIKVRPSESDSISYQTPLLQAKLGNALQSLVFRDPRAGDSSVVQYQQHQIERFVDLVVLDPQASLVKKPVYRLGRALVRQTILGSGPSRLGGRHRDGSSIVYGSCAALAL